MAKTIETNSIRGMFPAQSAVYTKVVAGYTVPVSERFHEGDTLTARDARALNNYLFERAGSVINSNLDRGSWKDLSDAEKLEKATTYARDYNFSDDIGADVFGMSLTEQGCDRVIAELHAEHFANMTPSEAKAARAPFVAQMMDSPELAEKYRDRVEAAMQAVLAERHGKRTAKPKAADLSNAIAL